MAGDALPVKRAEEEPSDALSPRRKGIRRAAKLVFFSAVLVPVFLVISLIFDEAAPMIFPFVVFFVGLVMMLYARLFSDKTAPASNASLKNPALNNQAAQTAALGANAARGSLSPATQTPIASVGREQVRTNELAQPPSVTENTTRLLDNG
jgi:hypothetical protein